jgi:5-methylcytosine-specific restriction endonuclease McrA
MGDNSKRDCPPCVECGAEVDAKATGRPPVRCPECRLARRRRRALMRQMTYAARNRSDVLARRRVRYKRDAAQRRADAREYWRGLSEARKRERYGRWKPSPEYKAEIRRRTRARKVAPGSPGVSLKDWNRLVARYGWQCAYCGTRPTRLEQDHVIPLARGGRHAIGNVLPSCRQCNAGKGALLLVEWRWGNRCRGAARMSQVSSRRSVTASANG